MVCLGEEEELEFESVARQLEDLDALGEWAYLATDMCMFKALDEVGFQGHVWDRQDRALTDWWLSPMVERGNFLGVST